MVRSDIRAPPPRGWGVNNPGAALLEVRRFEEAITACQDAAAAYRETGDRHGEGRALNNLGIALREVRRSEQPSPG
jgi:Tetratricopeptide repeat